MAGKAVALWRLPVPARKFSHRPMSPASKVGLEAHRFESCQEQNFFTYKSNKMSTFS